MQSLIIFALLGCALAAPDRRYQAPQPFPVEEEPMDQPLKCPDGKIPDVSGTCFEAQLGQNVVVFNGQAIRPILIFVNTNEGDDLILPEGFIARMVLLGEEQQGQVIVEETGGGFTYSGANEPARFAYGGAVESDDTVGLLYNGEVSSGVVITPALGGFVSSEPFDAVEFKPRNDYTTRGAGGYY